MKVYRLAVLMSLVVGATGCAQSLPLISHAHIGHSLTAWRDTPAQQGLFVIAEQEVNTAYKEIRLAAVSAEPAEHINNAIHALNPDLQEFGAGLGFGGIRALEGAIDHLSFAAESGDASPNLKRTVVGLNANGAAILEKLNVAVEAARLASQASGSELTGLVGEIQEILRHCVEGDDLNGDGIVATDPNEFGLVQLRSSLLAMLALEKEPPYLPVGKKYLLGLVKLPNGKWSYKFNRAATDSTDY